jgi:hypothetical protein
MTKVLYQFIHASGDEWIIEQDPLGNGSNQLVRFMHRTPKRKLLDQVAEWTGIGWDGTRWVPKPPVVPRRLLNLIETRLR